MKKQSYFTARHVEHFKADPERRIEVPAGPPSGLYLIVHSSGKKSWALRYRWRGRPSKLTFGKSYPEMGLAAARAEAEAALDSLERGINPAAAKAEEEPREPDNVRAVAREWIVRNVKPRARTWAEVERVLHRDVLPAWDKKLITEIGRADVLRVLDTIVDRGAPISANRTFEVLRSWFNWCVQRGILPVSPVAGIRHPSAEKSRDRVLEHGELSEVWAATESLGYPFGPFVQFLILTAQRRREVSEMRWEEVNFDKALWTLSAERTKPGRVHDVPLSVPALDLLANLPRFEGPFIFTSTSGAKPINSFSKCKARLDARILKRRPDGLTDWRLHDLRRTAATWMAGAGVQPQVLAAILNHTPGSTQGVTSIYNRFRYEKERREALERWAQHVLSLAVAESDAAAVGA